MHLIGFHCRNVSRCTVLWMSNEFYAFAGHQRVVIFNVLHSITIIITIIIMWWTCEIVRQDQITFLKWCTLWKLRELCSLVKMIFVLRKITSWRTWENFLHLVAGQLETWPRYETVGEVRHILRRLDLYLGNI